MQVDQVRNSNNTSYTVGAVATGAVVGGLGGWYSKPFLKKGEPTDEFLKNIENNLNKDCSKILPDEVRNVLEQSQLTIKELDKINTVEDLKGMIYNPLSLLLDDIPDSEIDVFKSAILESNNTLAGINPELNDHIFIEDVKKAASVEDVKQAIKESLNREFDGKSIEEIKNTIKIRSLTTKKKTLTHIFNSVWDNDKKKFLKFEENPFSEIVTKSAKSIQGKYAAICATIGAAVLGIGTFLALNTKNSNKAK